MLLPASAFAGAPLDTVKGHADKVLDVLRDPALNRGTGFTEAERDTVAYALRGIKWFHRQLMLSHGALAAVTPLTPTERRVLHLLLTGIAEKLIAAELERSQHTVNECIAAIFRKFGVNNRAALMSLWLGQTV